jgi:alkylation response protein AidB-like acyl-CoA dehydrogenase
MSRIDPSTALEFVETVRSFVQRDVIPVASELEHADTYPERLVEQLATFGLFGALIPAEYGGLGLDVITYARVVEELAAGWMSLTGVLNTHMIAATLIRLHGTDEQRARLLPAGRP